MKRDLKIVYQVLKWIETNVHPCETFESKQVELEQTDQRVVSEYLSILSDSGFIRKATSVAYDSNRLFDSAKTPFNVFPIPFIYRGLSWEGYELLERLEKEF